MTTVVWIIFNLAGVMLIWSHIGERKHRLQYPVVTWNIEEWTLQAVLMLVIGVFINVFFWYTH